MRDDDFAAARGIVWACLAGLVVYVAVVIWWLL